MVLTRSQSHLRSISNNSTIRNRSPSAVPSLHHISSNKMLRTIKVHFNKNQQPASQESSKISSLSINSLQSTSLASSPPISQPISQAEASTTLTMRAAGSPSMLAKFESRCVRVFGFFQSVLGVIGGAYAIYRIYDMYIMPRREERIEVLVLRRS